MLLCCALSDWLENRRNRRRRGSGSISDDYSSEHTTEGTVCRPDLPPVDWETVTPCFCLERRARKRNKSCPSRLSTSRRLPVEVLPRSVSLNHRAHHQSNRCQFDECFTVYDFVEFSSSSSNKNKSYPSRVSSSRRFPTEVSPRSVTINPRAYHQSKRCQFHDSDPIYDFVDISPPSPTSDLEQYQTDRCADRLIRTRERRERSHKNKKSIPPKTVAVIPPIDQVTNVVYKAHSDVPCDVVFVDETHETATYAASRRKKVCILKKKEEKPETTHVEIHAEKHSPSSESDKLTSLSDTLAQINQFAANIRVESKCSQLRDNPQKLSHPTNEKQNLTEIQVKSLPIYVTKPATISDPYAQPSCSYWPDLPRDLDYLPKNKVDYLTVPSQASFYSSRRSRKSAGPPSITPLSPSRRILPESTARVHRRTSKSLLKTGDRQLSNPELSRKLPSIPPRVPDRPPSFSLFEPSHRTLPHPRGSSLLRRQTYTPPPLPARTAVHVPPKLHTATTDSSQQSLTMNEEYRDRKIVLEFTHLLEKSKQLFTGLRALPQHGHKHWQFYFSRTFDVYTKLWKYQQQHRSLLNEEYGLRRWQIGEIASKIGQLYYHFYLRTSEVTYLFDAYEFYAAIRGRGYYAKAADESNGDLMIKRLRYYTRFIVVSLLTRKLKFVEELISELDDVIMEYGDSYDPEDQIQWTMVSSEVKAFLAVECAIIIEDPECKKSLRTKTRLTPVSIPCIDKTPQMNLRLQKAVIIGSGSYQARVSELTIDMYRILQTIEREPVQSREVWEEPRNPFADGFDRAFNIEIATANAPEKNLLFKPSPTQALVFIASACDDLSPIGALLLYISADGVSPNTKGGEDYGFETGGLITTSKSDIYGEVRASTPARYKEIQCLHPGDLQPFTRKPLFMIVDSDHSTIFLKMRRPFEMPMVILMSPTELPPSLKEYENMGGLLTLFLYCPLGAVCRICSVDNVTADMWVEAQIHINNFLQEAVVVAVRLPLDSSYMCFLGDDFLRVQIARYIFCELVLRMHRGFVSRNHLPRASPSLPEQLFENIALTEMVLELATFLKIRNQFFNPLGAGGGSNNN